MPLCIYNLQYVSLKYICYLITNNFHLINIFEIIFLKIVKIQKCNLQISFFFFFLHFTLEKNELNLFL